MTQWWEQVPTNTRQCYRFVREWREGLYSPFTLPSDAVEFHVGKRAQQKGRFLYAYDTLADAIEYRRTSGILYRPQVVLYLCEAAQVKCSAAMVMGGHDEIERAWKNGYIYECMLRGHDTYYDPYPFNTQKEGDIWCKWIKLLEQVEYPKTWVNPEPSCKILDLYDKLDAVQARTT